MNGGFRLNANVIGILFVTTMLAGMVDTYFVAPKISTSPDVFLLSPGTVMLGFFSVFFMAMGVVAISATLYPIVRRHSEAIAMTYVGFRIVECGLLLIGPILYLVLLSGGFVLSDAGTSSTGFDESLVKFATKIKMDTFQMSMVILGIGSVLLNISFYRSKVIPRWLSIWGMVGYVLLFLSAALSLVGYIDTFNGVGILMYIPGGLWELIVLPVYLFIFGFSVNEKT